MTPANDDRSDAELAIAAKNGDAAALEVLLRRHFSATYAFVRRAVANVADADDITQETFVRAWRHLRSFDVSKSFRTWVFRIARNAAIDLSRKRKIPAFSDRDDRGEGDDTPNIEDVVLDPRPLASASFDSALLAKKLEAATSALPLTQRMAVFLHLEEGRTFREISDILGVPLDTVKSRFRRALAALRVLLKDDAPK